MKKIVILASGNGSNAECIMDYFKRNNTIKIALVLSNNPLANVLNRAKKFGISAISFNREALYKDNYVHDILTKINPDLIVLAGFLWLIPTKIIESFSGKIINIHPALLPDFGGKGMYGMHVHNAVIGSGKKESGITIHYVSPEYDKGNIIFQARTTIESTDNPEQLAQKIHKLEHEHFPKEIEKLLIKG